MENETMLISGASSGIGRATALILATTGRNLIITGRRKDRLDELAEQLRLAGANVFIAGFDVRDKQQVQTFVNELPKEFRRIRVLVNSAGLAAGLDFIQDGDTDDWDSMIDTNIKGLLYLTRAALPLMIGVNGAQIVNVGSVAGREMYAKGNVYCASKAAVDALTRTMRIDLLDKGVRVSSVSPGMVETEFSMVRFKGDEARSAAVYKGIEPLTGKDVAEAIRYIVESPFRINVADMLLFPSAQASARDLLRTES